MGYGCPVSSGPDPAASSVSGQGEIRLGEDGAGPLLLCTGVLDRETVRRFRLAVPPTAWPPRADLTGVTAIDAAGLELLVHLARKPRRRGRELVLVGLPERLHPALDRAGLSGLLPPPGGTSAPA